MITNTNNEGMQTQIEEVIAFIGTTMEILQGFEKQLTKQRSTTRTHLGM